MREEGLRKPMDLTSHPVCFLQPIFTSHLGPHWPPEVMSPSVQNGAGEVGKGGIHELPHRPTRHPARAHPRARWAAASPPLAPSGPQFPPAVKCTRDQGPCQLFCPRTGPPPHPGEAGLKGKGRITVVHEAIVTQAHTKRHRLLACLAIALEQNKKQSVLGGPAEPRG